LIFPGLPFKGLADLAAGRTPNRFVERLRVEEAKSEDRGDLGDLSLPSEQLRLDPVRVRNQSLVFERLCEVIVIETRFDRDGGSILDFDAPLTLAA